MTRILFRNAQILDSESGGPTALAVENDQIAWLGTEDGAAAWENADRTIDLAGDTLSAGFVDAHTHAVQTGFAETGLDLTGLGTREEVLDRLAAYAQRTDEGAVVVGQGWDETLWPHDHPPTGAEIERAAPGARVILTRVDGHSSVLSPTLATAVPGIEGMDGWSEDGRVERDASHAVRVILATLIGPEQRLDSARAACQLMAREGVVAFHENAAPHIGPEYEVDLVREAAAEVGLHATIYWGELGALDAAQRLGVAGLAGDLNADGAVGSRTCSLHDPYTDAPDHRGHAYLRAEEIADHVELCTDHGLQAGFHCIGDAAMEAIAEGFHRAAAKVGADRIRAGRHRLEHVEMPSSAVIATLADLHITASVQPVFDALWGGPDQMYAERLGERWRGMNPFGTLEAAGVSLAFGSDSPVTPIRPWAAIRAAVQHHELDQRVSVASAYRAHTSGGWSAAGHRGRGVLSVGAAADLAVWHLPAGANDHGYPALARGAELPHARLTMAQGRIIHEEDA